jgi:hypothetical protein
MQQSHAETCNILPHLSHILDAIKLQSLRITTFAHWELGAGYASSAATRFSALRVAAYLCWLSWHFEAS